MHAAGQSRWRVERGRRSQNRVRSKTGRRADPDYFHPQSTPEDWPMPRLRSLLALALILPLAIVACADSPSGSAESRRDHSHDVDAGLQARNMNAYMRQ
jgi:hypothetical protein